MGAHQGDVRQRRLVVWTAVEGVDPVHVLEADPVEQPTNGFGLLSDLAQDPSNSRREERGVHIDGGNSCWMNSLFSRLFLSAVG